MSRGRRKGGLGSEYRRSVPGSRGKKPQRNYLPTDSQTGKKRENQRWHLPTGLSFFFFFFPHFGGRKMELDGPTTASLMHTSA